MSVAAQLPHPRSAAVSRFRLVSSLRSSTRLPVHDGGGSGGSSTTAILPSFLSFFLFPSFFPPLSRSGSERSRARATLYHRRPNNANRGANARATPGRERDEEIHGITTSRKHHSLPLSRRDQRARRKRRRRKEEGGKASRLPLSHTRAPFVTWTLPIAAAAPPHHHHLLLLFLFLLLLFPRDA